MIALDKEKIIDSLRDLPEKSTIEDDKIMKQTTSIKLDPFDIKIPNESSQKIFTEIREGKNVDNFSTDELKRA